MKTSKEIQEWLLKNAMSEYGEIELNGLELNVDLVIKNCKIKNYRSHSNEVKGHYRSYYNKVEGNYYSHSNEVKGHYRSYYNKVKGNYHSDYNEVEGVQFYPEYVVIEGKKYNVDMSDNFYTIVKKSTTRNGLTVIDGLNRQLRNVWIYKNNFVSYHATTKEDAKAGFKRKLKGFEANIELIKQIKEQGYITRKEYHNLTGACNYGINEFAKRIGKEQEDKLSLDELFKLLKPSDYGYTMIIKWFKEEENE